MADVLVGGAGMEFSGGTADDTRDQVDHALVSALVAASGGLPVTVTLILSHHEPLRLGDVLAALGCLLAPLLYIGASMAIRRHQRGFVPSPVAALVGISCAVVAVGFAGAASGSPAGPYDSFVVVGALFVGVVGDRTMRAVVGATCVGVVGTVGWAAGVRGGQLAVLVVMNAWVVATVLVFCARVFTAQHVMVARRGALRSLTEAIAQADSVTDALAVGVPLVAGVLQTDRVVVFAADAGLAPRVVTSWPGPVPGDAELAGLRGFASAARTATSVYRDGSCFVPIGYAEGAALVMVLRHRKARGVLDAQVADTCEQIAATFLKMINRAAYVADLRQESRTDPLTGLANRRALHERLEAEVSSATALSQTFCIAMIDLDEFKRFNDEHGHVAGDTLLRWFAALFTSSVRAHDHVARYGGEEFCVVMPATELPGAHQLMERIREKAGGDDGRRVTFSVGVAQWDGSESPTSLVRRADGALYAAKQQGRDRVVAAS